MRLEPLRSRAVCATLFVLPAFTANVSRREVLIALAAVLIALTMLGAIHREGAGVKSISMAVEFNDHSAAAWVALDTGLFQANGINVTHLETFRTGLELAAALARGDVDVAWACLGPTVLARARGVPIKVVAGAHLHGYAIVARPGISNLSQLSGGVVAAPGKGSPAYLLLAIVNERYGLNVSVKKMAPQIAVNAVMTGQVDAAALPEHYATLAVVRGGCRVLVRSQDVWPDMPGSVLVVREDLLESDPELVSALVRATVQATDFILENPEDAARIVASRLGISKEEAAESMSHLEYSVKLDLNQMEEYVNLMVRYGCIERPVPVDELVDTSILGEVLGSAPGP